MISSLLIGVLIAAVIGIVSLIGGSLIWSKTRPKKQTWFANVYRVGDGVNLQKNKKGEYTDVKLRDLIPLQKDIAEKIDEKPGITIFRLQKLKTAIPPITEDVVTYWGSERKEVDILCYKGNYSLLKKGYDKDSGDELFVPIPVDDINVLESNMALKRQRYKDKKDILEAISPFVTAMIIGLVITANTYMIVSGWKYVSDEFTDNVDRLAKLVDTTGQYAQNIETIRATGQPIVATTSDIKNKETPPLIEDLG